MKSQEYKTIVPSADISTVLSQLSERLARMEARFDAIESQLGSRVPAEPRPPRAWPHHPISGGIDSTSHASQAGLSVFPSDTPSQVLSASRELLLAPADEQIVAALRSRGALCAEQVRVIFGYRGKNAASARLSRLYDLGILEKQQAGRVVYYRMK